MGKSETEKERRGRAAITRWHREKRSREPRCGARRKHDGKPCQQIAMENGRCAWHGGLTPKGDAWHKPRWPKGDSPTAEKKLQRKLRDLDRAAKKRAARVAAMTPADRERYERWHKARKPGSAKARAAARHQRKMNQEARALFARLERDGEADR